MTESSQDTTESASEYSFDVKKTNEGISISVYEGLALIEETWRTWAELDISDPNTINDPMSLFEFSAPVSGQ